MPVPELCGGPQPDTPLYSRSRRSPQGRYGRDAEAALPAREAASACRPCRRHATMGRPALSDSGHGTPSRLACRDCVSNCTLRGRGIALPGQQAILLPCFDRQYAAVLPFCPREDGTAPPHPVPSRTAFSRRSFFSSLMDTKRALHGSALFSSNSTSGKAQTVPATFPARPPRSRSARHPRSCGPDRHWRW